MNTRIITFKPLLFALLAVAGLFAGCSEEDALIKNVERTPVVFHPNTRTAFKENNKTFWKEGDAVGIFMLKAGGTMPGDIVAGAENNKYSASDAAMGTLVPTDGQSIYYPMTDAVDFIAYHPFVSEFLDGDYLVHMGVGDQTTAEKQSGIDLIYSNNAKNIRKSENAVVLEFRHLLGKVMLDITLGTGLKGGNVTEVKLSGMPEAARFDLRDASIEKIYPPADGKTISSLKQAVASTNADATFTALVVPQEMNIYTERKILVTVGGEVYTGTIPAADTYEGNKMYVYPVMVHKNGVDVGKITIADWVQNDQGTDGTTEIGKGIEKVFVPAGTFMMGSPENEAGRSVNELQHRVTLTRGFYMSKYEITNAQYAEFLNTVGVDYSGKWKNGLYPNERLILSSKGSSEDWGVQYEMNKWKPAPGYENHPVILVTWYGALEYARWMGGTLPTEAQWEYACRGGQTESLPFGIGSGRKLTGEIANIIAMRPYDLDHDPAGDYRDDSQKSFNKDMTSPVGSYAPNGYGLYDMHGNVWEWCLDQWDGYSNNYMSLPSVDPVSDVGSNRIYRGGAWFAKGEACRSAYRVSGTPNFFGIAVGFRVVF